MKHWLQRAARGLGWDGNPLRRGIDKAERLAMTAMVAALVIAGPILAVSVGQAAYAAARSQQRSESGWYQRQAVLLRGADQAVSTSGAGSVAWVRASWTLKDGEQRTGLLAVPLDARSGQTVQVWLTPAGQITRPRLTEGDVRDEVMFAVLLVISGWAVVLSVGALAVRLLADRGRMAGWQREWDASGPLWSRQG